jgi:Ca2+-binding EF-hand superfamily protein
MASGLRDAIDEKLLREKTLAGCVGKLFQFVPPHLVPVDQQFAKASIILDRMCFHMLTQRLLGRTVSQKQSDDLFDELDSDATGFLSLAEMARRLQRGTAAPTGEEQKPKHKSTRPTVSDLEVSAMHQQLQAKLAALVTRDKALVSQIVMLFERAGKAGEITHRRGKMQVLNMGEFHHLLLRMLHIPVSREVSDALFCKIVALPRGVTTNGEMAVNQFIAAAMPADWEHETWHDVRRSEMARLEERRKDPGSSFNDHLPPAPKIGRTKFNPAALRTKIGDQLARLTSADSHVLQTMVKIFMSADPKGRTSHISPSHGNQRCISCDEFHHVLTRILSIPCTPQEASLMFHSYAKGDANCLTLEEFVHQCQPPEYSEDQWNLRREMIMRKGRDWVDDAAGIHHKRHSLHIQRAAAGMSVRTLVSVHGTRELAHSVKQRLQANGIDGVDGINHIVRLFLLVGTDKPPGNKLLGGELGEGCTATKVHLKKPGFYELITGRLNVFCTRAIVDDWFDKLVPSKTEITAMDFAERVFGNKKYDPKLLLNNKVCHSAPRKGLLPQEGIPDEHGQPMFGYGLSARDDGLRLNAKADGIGPPELAADRSQTSANPFHAGSTAVPVAAPNKCPKIATPSPFSNADPTDRTVATADSTRSNPHVPSRPSYSRSSKHQRVHSVHARATIRKPVVAHKKYTGKSDLPKHLLFKAMNVHANNLL